MIYKIPREFLKGFDSYTVSDYKVITSKIEEIFGYEIIQKEKEYYESLFVQHVDSYDYDVRGNKLPWYKSNTRYELNGILTYDKPYNRFVIFLFRKNFHHDEMFFQINGGISHFSENWKHLNVSYNNTSLEKIEEQDVNKELTKLVVLYENTTMYDLLDYFNPKLDLNRYFELWRITSVDENITILEKCLNDFKEDSYRENQGINEEKYLDYFDVDKKTQENYHLFQEYLRNNFLSISTGVLIDYEKVDFFLEELNFEKDEWDETDWKDHISEKKTDLQTLLDHWVKHFNQLSGTDGGKLQYQNAINFLRLHLSCTNHYLGFCLNFNISIQNRTINVKVYTVHKDFIENEWDLILEFLINNDSNETYFLGKLTQIEKYLCNFDKSKYEKEKTNKNKLFKH